MKSILTKAISTLIAACALLTIIPTLTNDSLAYADAPRVRLNRTTNTTVTATETAQTTTVQAAPARTAYWDHGLRNGFTYGLGLGWYGQYVDGHNTENGISFSLDAGVKWRLLGFEADLDFSVSPTEYHNETVNTYSFTGMIMGYLPVTDFMMATVGVGVGYTRWSYEREYEYYTDHFDEWGYLGTTVDSETETLKSCGNLSLKLAARADFLISDRTVLGLEFNWIPMLNKGDIVNNIFGVKVRIGGAL